MVFQGYTLFPWRTVRENVMFGLEMRGLTKNAARDQAQEWVEIVGLRKFADAYPYQLSGGMKQRVAIARALANRPRILFMDEPFAALDAQTRVILQEELLRIWGETGAQDERRTVVFITHGIDEAVFLADRVVVMGSHPGRIREIKSVDLPRPRKPEMRASAAFQDLVEHIWQLIRDEAYAATVKA
jgi:NitT/TauT family transport system ATP-binding protein